MKKIFVLLLVLSALTMTRLSAQSFCAGITVETFPLNPQSGAHNYFGIRIKLDMVYDQDVTISGYLYYLDHYNTDHPFSLTITAGNVSVETSATYFEMSPAIDDVETTISVSPSTLTAGGVSFGTSCSNSTPYDRLTAIGTLHNSWMNSMLSYLVDNNVDLRDTSSLKTLIASQLNSFLTSNGLPTGSYPITILGSDTGTVNLTFNSGNYSTAGAAILSSLQSLVGSYDPNDDTGFLSSLESLQSDALALSDPNEVYTVGLPVTVAIYSYSFFKTSASGYADALNYQDSIRQLTAYVPFNFAPPKTTAAEFNLSGPNFSEELIFETASHVKPGDGAMTYFKKPFQLNGAMVVGMDEVGALAGAYGGTAGGPAGMVAGAILGSSAMSLRSMVMQAFKWWLFG